MKFCPYFLHSYQIWITFSTDVHNNLLVLFEVVEISTVKSILHIGKKVKCTLVQALRLCTGRMADRGSRGISLLFLDHSTRRR